MHLSLIGYRCSHGKLLCSWNYIQKETLLKCFYGGYADTQNPVLLALCRVWSRWDGASLNWMGLNLYRKLIQLFRASFWLCAFPNLAYWIFRFFLLVGPFCCFLFGLLACPLELDLISQWACKRKVRRQEKKTGCPPAAEGQISLFEWGELDSSIHTIWFFW